jgi:hypothetical protein
MGAHEIDLLHDDEVDVVEEVDLAQRTIRNVDRNQTAQRATEGV